MTRIDRTGHTTIIDYSALNSQPVGNASSAVNTTPEPQVTTRAGISLQRAGEMAGASKVVTDSEISVILNKASNVSTKAELADAFIVFNKLVDTNLMSLENRAKLGTKLWEMAGKIEGGNDVVPLAVTEAVGEDVFGMGALELSPIASRVLKVAKDEVVSSTEARGLVGMLGQVQDRFELFSAYNALRFMVQGNAITTEDRGALSTAYHQAADRIGDGFIAVTRSPDEDVFGSGRSSIAQNAVAKAIANQAISAAEVTTLVAEIGKLTTSDQLTGVYFALADAIGVRGAEGGNLIKPKDRTKLSSAIMEANARIGGNNLPLMATRALGEDIFGSGNVPLMPPEQRLLTATSDVVISSQETTALVKDIKAVRDAEAFGQIFAVVKQAVALNLITRDDREKIKDALAGKGQELDVHFPVTRGLFEDIIGFYPPV